MSPWDPENGFDTMIQDFWSQADYHGCPYKTWSADQLSATLSQMKLGNNVARDVVQKAKAGHYQIACGLAFEGFHGCSCDSGINHPNQVQYIVSSHALQVLP